MEIAEQINRRYASRPNVAQNLRGILRFVNRCFDPMTAQPLGHRPDEQRPVQMLADRLEQLPQAFFLVRFNMENGMAATHGNFARNFAQNFGCAGTYAINF